MMVTDTFKKKSAALAIVLALALIGTWGLLPSKADAETANSGETLQTAAASLSGVDVPGFCTKGNSANLSVSNLRMAQSIARLENPTTKLTSSARTLTDRELSNIRLVIPSGGFVYDGTPKMPTVTGLPSGVTASDYEMTYENNIKAGTNTAVARITFNDGVVSGEKEFTFSIAKAKITVSGITAKDKEYDASKTATLNYDNVVLDGKVANDILFVTAKGVFSDSSTGQDKVVKISNIRLFGPSSSNYVLASTGQQTSTTASITLEELEGISIKLPSAEYVYDGTAKEPAVLGLDGNANYTIKYENNVKAGENTAKVVVTLNKDGAKLPKVFYFSIAQAKVTVSGITAKSKNYDGTTKATLNLKDAEVAGKVAKDTVSVTATGEFDSAEEGTGKTVFISDIALTGRDASNYYLAESGNQTTTTADILPKEVKLHTITLNPNGGTVTPTSVQYDEYTGLLTLPTPSRPGYTFAGWHRGVTRYDSIPGDSYFYYDFTLTAKWTANTYTVTFDPNGGTVSTTSKTYTTDKGLSSLPNPTRTGYTFDGWYVGNTLYKKIPAGTYGDMTLKAEWTENSYQIEYALNGGKGTKPSTQTVKYTQEVKLATGDGFSRDGYTFAGWSYNNKTYAGGSVASKLSTGNEAGTTEIVMKAVWKANEYTLTLDPNGGTVENSTKPITKKFTTDSGLSSLPNPERAGYTFDGWYNGNIRYTKIIAGTISDITLTAKWTPITYTVTFKPNGGTASATTMKYTTDKGLSTLATATRTGYTFNGWYLNNKEYKKIEAGTIGNLTLTAGWTENSYTIKYNLNGGTGTTPSAQTVKYTANAKLATNTGFSKAGYEFAGWNFGSKTYAANAQVSKLSTGNSTGTTEITMTATWKVVSYSITYNGNGGTVGSTSGKTSYTIENGLASLPDASRNGYDFDGWYAGNTKYTSIPKGTYGNLTLTAKWTSKEYTVTYNADGGSVTPSSQKYKTDTGLSSLPNATKTGYTFSGWYNGNTKYTSIAKGTYGNLTLTAKWSVTTYNINYTMNGGTNISTNPKTYNITTNTITLKNPTRNGYTFAGWTGSNGSTPQTTVKIAKGSTGEKSYTANWKVNTYNISYNLGGGSVSGNPTTYNIETNTFTLKNPTKSGYTFAGWTGSNGSTKSTSVKITKGSTGNKTYTANWTEAKGKYWFAPAGASNPESSVYKSQATIDSDIAAIRSNPNGSKATEYKNLMNNDKYHLYTKWNGSDGGSGKNRWVEFRIIQVGAHDSDGSAVTFMATHCLPTAYIMTNDAKKNNWTKTEVHKALNDANGYAMNGLSDLKSSVKKVQKKYISETRATEIKSDYETFWSISYSELMGKGSWQTSGGEGSQYDWFKDKKLKGWATIGQQENPCLANVSATREGEAAKGAYKNYKYAWTRSRAVLDHTSLDSEAPYEHFMANGSFTYKHSPKNKQGIIPSFAF